MIKSDKNNIEKTELEKKTDNEENLTKKEESIEEKLKNLEEKLLRTLAEMENQRRRFEKEKQDAFEFGGFNFARETLGLLDNIDRAIASFKNDDNLKNSKDLEKIIAGIEVVKKDLVSIFSKNGIESIECLNKKFDPNFHQAMLEIEDTAKDPGIVVQEIQKGYMMKDRLLRPSLVGVAKKKVENSGKNKEEDKKNEKK